ncbi:phosphoglucosamine mutase [Oceanirhabdus seepicola]|uniref:Phosphoglucosamine mutase n=1 Tax=Oceanirhabdus seepicola TaxID=2828781 RepID=A0A9J6P0V3_9CLOT|nr:phosphoglucosamine mutase [Oceanirhabdus seepicola]MCM1989737.1 phosphoglucosamine mutase [Oceanirhabdus seepicola]
MGRLFGTDGVRGIANKELTCELAFRLGKAGAITLTDGAHKPKIIVGMDTRISGNMLEAALTAGILSVGAEVVSLGVVPTPAVAYLVRKYNADAGVMISASHNPVEDNGIKFFNGNGYKLSDELEDRIEKLIEDDFEGIEMPIGENIGRSYSKTDAIEDYVDYVTTTVDGDLSGLKIALDCANGAAYKSAVDAFRKLKAEVLVINNDPDGININKECGSTHPEHLMQYVVNNKCDLGIALDGDADRCMAVDEKGNLVNGDFILAICSKYLKEKNKLFDNTVVVTVMSNMGLDIALDNLGIKCARTIVGDRYVLEEMRNKGYRLGGEQSGHIIFLEHNTTGDGLLAGLQLATIIKNKSAKMSELTSIMRELPQVLVNATVPNSMKDIYIKDNEIAEEIRKIEMAMNGVGRVLIRPSGTEPLVRVMLEGENQKEIDKYAHELAKLIEEKAKA